MDWEEAIRSEIAGGRTEGFRLLDLAVVAAQLRQWMEHLPMVAPFFAIKSNPDAQVIQLLNRMGAGFDCASKGEIDTVLELGVDASRIVYANPYKSREHIRHAKRCGVVETVVDSLGELEKMKEEHPHAHVLVRLAIECPGSSMDSKFGVPAEECMSLIKAALARSMNVSGICFHVGSTGSHNQCEVMKEALRRTRWIFERARRELGIVLSTVDVGGGFPGDQLEGAAASEIGTTTFVQMASTVSEGYNAMLDSGFPNVRFIAEPGQYFVYATSAVATRIIAARPMWEQQQQPKTALYVDDSVYQSFLDVIMYPEEELAIHVIGASQPQPHGRDVRRLADKKAKFKVFGQTCDPIDVLFDIVALPEDTTEGDWLWFPNLGAYSHSTSTVFNGFKPPPVVYLWNGRPYNSKAMVHAASLVARGRDLNDNYFQRSKL